MVCSHANVQRAVQVVRTEGQRAAEAAAEAGSKQHQQHAWNEWSLDEVGGANKLFLWRVTRTDESKAL